MRSADVGDDLRLHHEIVEGLVAPLGDVGAGCRLGGRAAQQGVQEVVRIAVVARPAELSHLVLAGLGPLAILAPFEALDLSLHADLGEVGLHQLRDAACIRVVGALNRHRPQVRLETVRDSPLRPEASWRLPDRKRLP